MGENPLPSGNTPAIVRPGLGAMSALKLGLKKKARE
jgi:hypothetical protein